MCLVAKEWISGSKDTQTHAAHTRLYWLQVTLMGHSAGAHMCMMALLYRARAAAAAASGTPLSAQPQDDLCGQALGHVHDGRMPCQFLAVTGVFDISKHFVYEAHRGVEELSTMKRAIGGSFHSMKENLDTILPLSQVLFAFEHICVQCSTQPTTSFSAQMSTRSEAPAADPCLPVAGGYGRFASMSPSVIIANTLQAAAAAERLARAHDASVPHTPSPSGAGAGISGDTPPSSEAPTTHLSFYEHDSFKLSGEAIAHRIGGEQVWEGHVLGTTVRCWTLLNDMGALLTLGLMGACT